LISEILLRWLGMNFERVFRNKVLRDMQSAAAAIMSFPPQMMVNTNPTGVHDRILGSGGYFFNSLIEKMRLNVSLIDAASLGACRYSLTTRRESCEGIIGELATGSADFSIFPLPIMAYDHRIRDIPVLFGPNIADSELLFTSTPYQNAMSYNVTVLKSSKLPMEYYAFMFGILTLCTIFINWSLMKKQFKSHITVWNMIGTLLLKPTSKPFMVHRRITYACCLYLAFMNHQFFMGSQSSDMVTFTPRKYYETVAEVLASNATPAIRANVTMENYAERTGDHSITKLITRAAARGTLYSPKNRGAAMAVAQNINSTVSFFTSRVEANAAIGLSCFIGEFYPPFDVRISRPFEVVGLIVTFNKNVNSRLRKHVSRFYQLVAEMGIYKRFQTDTKSMLSSLGEGDKLAWCLSQMGRSREPDAAVRPFNVTFYMDLFNLFFIMTAFASCVFAAEKFSAKKNGRKCQGHCEAVVTQGSDRSGITRFLPSPAARLN
jgi:hypothetical protein